MTEEQFGIADNHKPDKQPNIDLTAEYTPVEWEVIGAEPSAPVFDVVNVSVEQAGRESSKRFVQGMLVETAGWDHPLLFDPESLLEKARLAALGSAHETLTQPVVADEGEQAEVLNLTETQLQELLSQAEQRGYEQAQEDLQAQLGEQLALVQRNWEDLFGDFRSQLRSIKKQLEREVTVVCTEIVEHFLRELSPSNADLLNTIVTEFLQMLDLDDIVELVVSEGDKHLLDQDEAFIKLQDRYAMRIVGDPQVRSGCIVRTSTEEFDFDVMASFDRAKAALGGKL